MLNFVENLLENERGPINDQDLTKTDYDPDRSLVLIEGLSHFLTNFLQNLASCQTCLKYISFYILLPPNRKHFNLTNYVQSQAINFGRQGHSLTQSKMLHCKTVVNIITYHHVV
jgi:hypothetical protein